MLKAEQIQKNWDTHLKIINRYISDPRLDKVLHMLNELGDNYIMSPASIKDLYHNAFPGGYLDHVNRVVRYALEQKELYSKLGGTIDFTDEELVVSALFHDLGKIGDGVGSNYLQQEDKWRRDKLGEKYINNPELDFMLIQDRSLYLLQKFGIELTQREYIAIRTHDGVFDKANEAYFFSRFESSQFKSNITYILHVADFLASKVEKDLLKNSKN